MFLPIHGRIPKGLAAITASVLLLTFAFSILYYMTIFDEVINEVKKGTSVSDLTRLAYQVAAFKIFTASPILGVGLGQFAFKAFAYMPTFGFLSPEISPSLLYRGAPWPNTYSIYARLAAELGIIGVAGWVTIWITLIVSVYRASLAHTRFGRAVPAIAYTIIMTSIAILATGVTTDTFRTPMIWITLGAGASFSARSRQLFFGRSRADLVRRALARHIWHHGKTSLPPQTVSPKLIPTASSVDP